MMGEGRKARHRSWSWYRKFYQQGESSSCVIVVQVPRMPIAMGQYLKMERLLLSLGQGLNLTRGDFLTLNHWWHSLLVSTDWSSIKVSAVRLCCS